MLADIRASQEKERGHQREDSDGAANPVAEAELGDRGVVLEPQQDELLFADQLPFLDQDLATSVRVVVVGNAVARLFAKLGSRLRLELQSW